MALEFLRNRAGLDEAEISEALKRAGVQEEHERYDGGDCEGDQELRRRVEGAVIARRSREPCVRRFNGL